MNAPARSIETTDGFDLFRLSKSKEVVDLCSNTLRQYNQEGLPFYKRGKAVFVSKTELRNFIVAPVVPVANRKRRAA